MSRKTYKWQYWSSLTTNAVSIFEVGWIFDGKSAFKVRPSQTTHVLYIIFKAKADMLMSFFWIISYWCCSWLIALSVQSITTPFSCMDKFHAPWTCKQGCCWLSFVLIWSYISSGAYYPCKFQGESTWSHKLILVTIYVGLLGVIIVALVAFDYSLPPFPIIRRYLPIIYLLKYSMLSNRHSNPLDTQWL